MSFRTLSRGLSASFGLALLLALAAPVAPVLAQDAPAAEAPAEPAAEAPAEEAPPPPSAAMAAGLGDPGIAPEELELRLIPLTGAEHQELADVWLGIVRDKTDEVVQQQIIAQGDDQVAADAAREAMVALGEVRAQLFDKFSMVLDSWANKGGDPAVIDGYRAYRSAIIVEETRQADWRTLVERGVGWLTSPDGGIRLGTRIAVVVASFLGLIFVARIVRAFARRSFTRIPNISRLLQAFLALAVYWLTIAFGLMIVLSALGVNVTPMFALVGGASFIVAFAMQDTLGNLAAGLMIMINHPFDEGDSVDIGGVSGTVRSVSVVSTTVITPDNEVIVVPNSKVWGNIIRNSTATDTRRIDMSFGVARSESVEKVQSVLEDVVRTNPLVLDSPAPVVRVSELTDGAIRFAVQPWARRTDVGAVESDLLRRVKESLEAAGIAAA